jgi:hypothetical protein
MKRYPKDKSVKHYAIKQYVKCLKISHLNFDKTITMLFSDDIFPVDIVVTRKWLSFSTINFFYTGTEMPCYDFQHFIIILGKSVEIRHS